MWSWVIQCIDNVALSIKTFQYWVISAIRFWHSNRKERKKAKQFFAIIVWISITAKMTFKMYFGTRTWLENALKAIYIQKNCFIQNATEAFCRIEWKLKVCTYESDNYGCFSGNIFFCNFPSIFGSIQTNNAQVFQDQTVRFESNVGDVGINRYIDFSPLVATCAGRQCLCPCRFNVWQSAGILQEFTSGRFFKHTIVTLCIVC